MWKTQKVPLISSPDLQPPLAATVAKSLSFCLAQTVAIFMQLPYLPVRSVCFLLQFVNFGERDGTVFLCPFNFGQRVVIFNAFMLVIVQM